MDNQRWVRIQEVFHLAYERPPEEWRPFLETCCGADREMLDEVLAMLSESARSDSVLDRELPGIAVDVMDGDTQSPPTEEFGPYRLKRLLGEGGMGVVWLAERTDVGTLVAVKFLLHAGLSPMRRERFLQEMRTHARLTHPLIARLYDAGALEDGTPWFVMEYVDGVPLTGFCAEHSLGLEGRLRLFRAVCEAVQYAHGQATIHRDLKPSNILVLPDGTPKLLDFGIARQLQQLDTDGEQTRPGMRFMTRVYASPEWAEEGLAGVTTDVYSLGVILYELLTGHLPEWQGAGNALAGPARPSVRAKGPAVDGGTMPAASGAISQSAWADLDVLCMKALHPERTQRYSTVEALMRDLDHYLKGEPLEARPAAWSYSFSKFVKRNRGTVLASCATALLVVGLTVAFTVRLARARDVAEVQAARTLRIQEFMLSLFQGSDPKAGPAGDLSAVTLIDRGAKEAQSLGAEPTVQADLYQTLGTAYEALGKLDKADALLDAGLKVRKSQPNAGTQDIADLQIARALLRSDQGRSPEADALAREALSMAQSLLPRNQVLEARAEAAEGRVLVDGGKYTQGAAVLERALAVESRANAGDDSELRELADTMTSLADAHMYLAHYDEVKALNERALEINRRIYGENYPKVATNLRNLGEYEEMREQYGEADKYEREALRINLAWYGPDHPETATAMTTLSQTLLQEGKYAEAEAMLHQAVATQRRVYGDEHPRVAYALNALGNIQVEVQEFKKAEGNYLEVIEIYRRAFGDGDYRVAMGMENLASCYGAEKEYARSTLVLKDALQRLIKAQGPDSLNADMARIRLGRLLAHERKFDEAVEYTRAGYESLVKQNSSETAFIQGALEDMSILYEKLHRPQDAERFKVELARVKAVEARAAGQK